MGSGSNHFETDDEDNLLLNNDAAECDTCYDRQKMNRVGSNMVVFG